MLKKDSIQYILAVALALCVVCSVVVSAAAVVLRPAQEANKAADIKRAILASAGILKADEDVDDQFANVRVRLVNFDTGEFTDQVPLDEYDQRKAADTADLSENVPDSEDIAKIGRRENYGKVYFADSDKGEVLVLPVRGYGLWSTMYGFVALESDYNTVRGIGFYEHGETPGLGGEVDNPRWKAIWDGKHVYGEDGDVALQVIKGAVDKSSKDAEYKVDGLSGATLTSRGVSNLIHYWFGENGYAPLLAQLKKGEA